MALERRDFQVLVVDDDAPIRELLRNILEDAGYRVRLAVNGAEALTLARVERPDVMLLDIGMPVVNGIEFVREYRTHIEPPHAPIVIISARGDARAVARDLDTDAFVNKPFTIDQVLEVIDRVVRERDQAVRSHAYENEDSLRRGSMHRRLSSPDPTAPR